MYCSDVIKRSNYDLAATSGLRLFGGNGNPALTAEIARCLNILPGNITVCCSSVVSMWLSNLLF